MFDFPLRVDSLDAVPEAYRPLYGEAEAGFALDGALAQRLDVSGLTSALEKERKAARDAEKALRTADERHAADAARLRGALERHLADSAATAAVAAARGEPALLLPHVRPALAVVEDGDDFAVRVLGGDGEARRRDDGEFLSVGDLVEELRRSPVFGRAFEASGLTGSGTPPTGAAGGTPGAFTLTREEARDPAAYRRLRDEAARAGQLPTIVE